MTDCVTALVLAGGQSTRMGRDKALLQLADGETLIEHALALAASVAVEVKLLGPRERYANLRWAGQIVDDVYPNCGPLAGIHAGLLASKSDPNLVLAVDMPMVTRDLLEFLLRTARQQSKLVTVVRTTAGWQPLCAVYKKEFAAVAEQALSAGRYKVDATFDTGICHIIGEREFTQAGFSPDLFANCNTDSEWQQFIASHHRV